MKETITWARAAAGLLLAGASHLASAQALPAAYGALHHPEGGGQFVGANASATFGCGSLTVSGGPQPTLVSSTANCGDIAQAILIYSFSVVGPASAKPIPVSISSTATMLATASYQAGYSLRVGFEDLHGGNCLLGYSETACGTHDFVDTRSFEANTAYGVVMMVITAGNLGSGGGYAFLDPVFTIDPQYASAYSMRFSEGVMNGVTSPVPEPETLLLMATGLLAVVARGRLGRAGAGSIARAVVPLAIACGACGASAQTVDPAMCDAFATMPTAPMTVEACPR